MRTNIVLNDELVQEAMKYTTARTKRALVEEALRMFVQVHESAKKREGYAARLREIRQKVANLQFREPPSEVLRRDRSRG